MEQFRENLRTIQHVQRLHHARLIAREQRQDATNIQTREEAARHKQSLTQRIKDMSKQLQRNKLMTWYEWQDDFYDNRDNTEDKENHNDTIYESGKE